MIPKAAKSFKIVRMDSSTSLDFSKNSGLTEPTSITDTECYERTDNKIFAGFV